MDGGVYLSKLGGVQQKAVKKGEFGLFSYQLASYTIVS